ncbi:MAG: acyltransferase [Candidatus Hodarchaeales archaeon]|jgi:acetyltransferase-like isoleucine patch superfamily enzyme
MKRSTFKEWKTPKIRHGELTQWNWMVQHPQKLKLGKYTDIGAFTYINAKFGVEIEDFVQIGSHCSVYSESTIDGKYGRVVIRKNARIGSHSLIMPGVSIGENSIIGAFSFVNKDIPNETVAFGIPIQIKRNLSSEELRRMNKEIEGE